MSSNQLSAARATSGPSEGETLLDNDFARLRYHARHGIVHHEFKQFIHGERFRHVLETGLEALRRHGIHKWLSDDRNNGPITAADANWAISDWAPRAIAAGWKYWAVVLPEKILGQMNMRRWAATYAKQGVTGQLFTDVSEAKRWLVER